MSGHKEHCSFHYHCIRTSTDVTQKVAKVPFTVSVSPINLQHEEDVDAIMHSLDGDFAAGVDLVFVWVERRQQGELRGLHAVPVVAVAVHGHLPGAELRENAPTATGARGRLAVVLVRGGGREEGRGGCQDDQEPRHAGTRGSRLRDRAEPEALSVVGDSESLKVRLVSHTAAAAACRLENEEASVAGLVGARKFRICPPRTACAFETRPHPFTRLVTLAGLD